MKIQNFSASRGDLRGYTSGEQVVETLKSIIAQCESFDDYYHMREEVSYLAACRTVSSEQADDLRSFINAKAGSALC